MKLFRGMHVPQELYPHTPGQWAAAAVCLFTSGLGLALLIPLMQAPQSDRAAWLLLLLPLLWYGSWSFSQVKDRRARVCAFLFCFLLLMMTLAGRRLEPDLGGSYMEGTTVGGLRQWLMLTGASLLLCSSLCMPVIALWHRLRQRSPSISLSAMSVRRYFLLCWGILMLCWIPVWLAYFPGMLEYDSGYQLFQSWNHSYNASNPLYHTFILGWFYLTGEALGSCTGGIACYCFVQMLCFSAALSFGLATLRQEGCPRLLLILILLFFGLLPVFPMLAISCTKDVLFYTCLLTQLLLAFRMCRSEGTRPWHWVLLGLFSLASALMRANALWGLALLAPAGNALLRDRKMWLRLTGCMLAGILLAAGVNAVTIEALQADKPMKRESLCLPIAQLARAQHYHEDVQADLVSADFVDMPMAYIPQLVDLSKWCFRITDDHMADFWRLWGRWAAAYPQDYVDAALLLNKGYWSLWDTSYASIYGHGKDSHTGILPSRVSHDISSITEYPLIPPLSDLYEALYSENRYLEYLPLRLLLSPAVYFWGLLLCLVSAMYLRRWRLTVLLLPATLLTLALLAGPCCIIRYALLLFMLTPLASGLLASPGRTAS